MSTTTPDATATRPTPTRLRFKCHGDGKGFSVNYYADDELGLGRAVVTPASSASSTPAANTFSFRGVNYDLPGEKEKLIDALWADEAAAAILTRRLAEREEKADTE